jgi:ABC-type transport system involved in cytochrome c biogenesis ATPase subunit
MANQPISQFSSGVCKKIPPDRRIITFENAIWILQNPAIRLNRIERLEVTCVLQNYMDQQGGDSCK